MPNAERRNRCHPPVMTVHAFGEHAGALEFHAATRHYARDAAADVKTLTRDGNAAELVRRSFKFLVAREPKESILRQFEQSGIRRSSPTGRRRIRPS